jgi:hypothetical protein
MVSGGFSWRAPSSRQLHPIRGPCSSGTAWAGASDLGLGSGGHVARQRRPTLDRLAAFAREPAAVDLEALARGFVRVHCGGCKAERLVAFSCKGRGICPSCGARRMHDTAARLVERVLPGAPFRQWVLTVPFTLRFRLARDPARVAEVLTELHRAIRRSHRAQARALGLPCGEPAAVTFVQRFGGMLNLHVHLHAVVADALFLREGEGVRAVPLPPPTHAEVRVVVSRVARRLAILERRLPREVSAEPAPDALAVEQLQAVQASMVFGAPEERRVRARRRCATVEGYTCTPTSSSPPPTASDWSATVATAPGRASRSPASPVPRWTAGLSREAQAPRRRPHAGAHPRRAPGKAGRLGPSYAGKPGPLPRGARAGLEAAPGPRPVMARHRGARHPPPPWLAQSAAVERTNPAPGTAFAALRPGGEARAGERDGAAGGRGGPRPPPGLDAHADLPDAGSCRPGCALSRRPGPSPPAKRSTDSTRSPTSRGCRRGCARRGRGYGGERTGTASGGSRGRCIKRTGW